MVAPVVETLPLCSPEAAQILFPVFLASHTAWFALICTGVQNERRTHHVVQ